MPRKLRVLTPLPRRSKGAPGIGLTEIEADQPFPDFKQDRGHHRTHRNILPGNQRIGQVLKDQGKEKSDDKQGDQQVSL